MRKAGDGPRLPDLPWLSWAALALAAFGLKQHYSRASVEDLAWILVPTARAVGRLRGETLALSGAGWMAPDSSYFIAPACAGVNFLILAAAVSVLCFAHRLQSPGRRLAWWLGSLFGAYVLTIAVNTLRILAAVELYRLDRIAGLTPEQAHRLLGAVLYLGALGTLFNALDRFTASRPAGPTLAAAVVVPAAYLGMTLGVPLLNGAFRQAGGQQLEHAAMVSMAALASAGVFALIFWLRRDHDGNLGKTDGLGGRG